MKRGRLLQGKERDVIASPYPEEGARHESTVSVPSYRKERGSDYRLDSFRLKVHSELSIVVLMNS